MQENLAEAKRRIEETRRTQAETLDLGDLTLNELPASLGELVHLKRLYLGKAKPSEAGELEWDEERKPPKLIDLSPLSRLQGLLSLDLFGCAGVTDLSPLASLQTLRFLILTGCEGVSDLSPLAQIRGLQSLGLWQCEGVKDLGPLVGLRKLRDLGLGSSNVRNLTPLASLQRLQRLDLACESVSDLAPLAELQELQELHLKSCKRVSSLAPLTRLQGLQRLDLWGASVTDLTPLARLQALQTVNISGEGITDLSPLEGLRGLQRLDLSRTGVTDLAPLARLLRLQNLQVGWTGVTDLAPLVRLRELQSLDCWSCEGLADLTPLARLPKLQTLRLGYTSVTDLSPLARLQGLQTLDLSGTGVTNLAPLAGLKELQSLELQFCHGVTDLALLVGLPGLQSLSVAWTGVKDLTPVAQLYGLQKLDLHGCQPPVPATLLRALIGHPRLTELAADEAAGVPQEVLSHDLGDNCLSRLRTYLSELDLGAEAENELKVILLGNGRVGKTQLCRRFRGQPFDESVQSTHGVQIWREELRIQTGDQGQVFQVNWWDFGGQDIYHGTHALFLRSRAVFLILWAPRLENREEYSENEIPLRNQPLAYWLDYARTLAGEDSPVIVVQSQCDRFADRRPDPPRPGVGFFECCPYSAKEGLGHEALEAHLRDAIRYLLERNGTLKIGHGRAEVRRRLYDWRSKDQKRKSEKRQHRTLTLGEFRALCNKVGGIVSWEHALDYLHHTGVVFYRPDLFSGRIILDQTWALDAVYTVFHRGRAVPLLRDSGRFTREDLAVLAWQEHSPNEQRLFLGLMESCGVCFPCGKTVQGETRYVAPDLLPRFEAVAGRLHAWKEEPGTPTLRLEYRFFHPAVIRGLMSEIGRRAGDFAEYWKYGLWLKDGRRDTQLLVKFQDTSTDDAPGAGALALKAQGRDPLGLLREIRKSLPRRLFGEEPEELLTLEGTTVARRTLATVVDGRALDLQNKPVAAAAFAAFFEGREHGPDKPGIDIHPRPLTASEKPREVFISYAWGDETPEGTIRAQVCDALYSALAKDGFLPVRDRDQIRPGERTSAFIRRLTRADLVVAVISDKYLRSSYCMSEIHGLWQKSQEDADLMVERLVPIVLPEVKIERLRDRAPYVRYWREQKEELEELFRELGPDLDPGSLRELRLVRDFAQDVDGILVFLQDVLMPRKLEAHLDDGFEAVREALRRKMRE